MITLLCGENIVASRKELENIKAKYQEVIVLDGKTVSETDFVQATDSGSLFNLKRLVVIEGLPKFDITKATGDIVVWDDKKLTPPPGVKVLEFKAPPSVFAFLNTLSVPSFRRALKDNDLPFIFAMLIWHFRKKGDKEKLKKLLEIDYAYKQGQLPCDLATHLELFLLL